MINCYTFYKQSSKGRNWICTNKPNSLCEAKVKLKDLKTVIPHNLEHNHPPPSYHVTKDGKYIKV